MKIRSSIREQAPKGIHTARVVSLMNLGHQPGFIWSGGVAESAYKLEITYELVTAEMKDGRPFWVSEELTNTDNERGNLVQRVAAAGVTFDTIDDILNKPVMVTVDHNKKGYSKVQQISGVPQGLEVPALSNPTLYFDIYADDPDLTQFYDMPEFKQDKFRSALDFDETNLAKALRIEEDRVPD